jgi:hypothetical protein
MGSARYACSAGEMRTSRSFDAADAADDDDDAVLYLPRAPSSWWWSSRAMEKHAASPVRKLRLAYRCVALEALCE